MMMRPIYDLMKILLIAGRLVLCISGAVTYGMTYSFINPLDRLITFTRRMTEEGRATGLFTIC